jgi:hypothetical protein
MSVAGATSGLTRLNDVPPKRCVIGKEIVLSLIIEL